MIERKLIEYMLLNQATILGALAALTTATDVPKEITDMLKKQADRTLEFIQTTKG